jgi:hypothetical protein
LVICTPARGSFQSDTTFASLAEHYAIELSQESQADLVSLPEVRVQEVGTVLVAVEAKACMTAHQRARPRLYDELSASQQVMQGESEQCIATALILVNASPTFISPTENKKQGALADPVVSTNRQPQSAKGVIEKVAELPRRSAVADRGYDAIGLLVGDAKNDGTEIVLVDPDMPSLFVPHVLRYDSMIDRVSRDYATRFRSL